MKNSLLSFFFYLSIFLSSVVATGVFAQTNMGPDVNGQENFSSDDTSTVTGPDTGNTGSVLNDGGTSTRQNDNTFEPGVGGGPGETTTAPGADNGLYWLWLLPLLAVPLLYFVWRSTDETSQSRGYRE